MSGGRDAPALQGPGDRGTEPGPGAPRDPGARRDPGAPRDPSGAHVPSGAHDPGGAHVPGGPHDPGGAGEDERLARVSWSHLVEASDALAALVVDRLGPRRALDLVIARAGSSARELSDELRGHGVDLAPDPAQQALDRWRVRLAGHDPRRDLDHHRARGGRLLVPGDPDWPAPMSDLGVTTPVCLWVSGPADLSAVADRSVALVGARASTPYGERVAGDLAAGLVERGVTVVSGGAYGIDGTAHRAALAAGGTTVAVLAGGVDHLYPRGHEGLLLAVAETGALVSESPPGCAPARHRFLARNRLIAALAGATVVVEAAWRSGALSTARRAADLLRPVAVVPGPVTSPASAGCHELVRKGGAVLVTDAAEVAELVTGYAQQLALPLPDREGPVEDHDGLPPDDLRVLDALAVRRGRTPGELAVVAGVTAPVVAAALGRLALRGLAVRSEDGARWTRRVLRRRPGGAA